jgi:hypothetical protein
VFAIGFTIAAVFLIAFVLSGTDEGVDYMASAMFFMALILGALTLLWRRAT